MQTGTLFREEGQHEGFRQNHRALLYDPGGKRGGQDMRSGRGDLPRDLGGARVFAIRFRGKEFAA